MVDSQFYLAASPEEDSHFMQAALTLAKKGLFTTTPNPRVGCVMVREGRIVATGFHEKAGRAHAEAAAIAQAKARDIDLSGATAYVTLEPCSHTGRTPPCADALVHSGVSRVVVATRDPNPLVAGKGIEKIKAAGITVTTGVLETEANWLNRGFFKRMTTGMPWVRLKVASSADGITALPNGVSQWITGEQARHDGHLLRAQACAVLTGIGTVNADNPRLNVRGITEPITPPRQPSIVVVDSHLGISPDAALLKAGAVYLAHSGAAKPTWLSEHPNRANIHLIDCQPDNPLPGQKNDLSKLLKALGALGMNEIHLEAGFGLNGSFLTGGLVDEIVQYMAPTFLGQGQGLFRLPELHNLPPQQWQLHSHEALGQDIKITWTTREQE